MCVSSFAFSLRVDPMCLFISCAPHPFHTFRSPSPSACACACVHAYNECCCFPALRRRPPDATPEGSQSMFVHGRNLRLTCTGTGAHGGRRRSLRPARLYSEGTRCRAVGIRKLSLPQQFRPEFACPSSLPRTALSPAFGATAMLIQPKACECFSHNRNPKPKPQAFKP